MEPLSLHQLVVSITKISEVVLVFATRRHMIRVRRHKLPTATSTKSGKLASHVRQILRAPINGGGVDLCRLGSYNPDASEALILSSKLLYVIKPLLLLL